MGSWGVQPMESDAALDWMSDFVLDPLLNAIENTLKSYLDEDGKDAEEHEAEIAAAFLADLTSGVTMWRYCTLDVRSRSKASGLWDLAIRAVEKMIHDGWHEGWTVPAEKLAALKELRQVIENVRVANNNDPNI